MENQNERVDCFQCQHFYITWDVHHPKGCRNYNFKTSILPSQKVKEAIGHVCPGFIRKDN